MDGAKALPVESNAEPIRRRVAERRFMIFRFIEPMLAEKRREDGWVIVFLVYLPDGSKYLPVR